ncbi:MAG: hypothetical protein ACRD8O_06130 [Bryobacteraceae bacterium]
MRPSERIWIGVLGLFLAWPVAAYEPETHAVISGAAVGASRLGLDAAILKDLGIEPTQTFRNSKGDSASITGLVQDGARFEDDFPRSLNHFYNPLTGAGISGFSPSPDWAIDGTGDISTTKFSFQAARQYMFLALTDRVLNFRSNQFGLMFQSLGQVIHHIQDMAQPQHTRQDLHCDIFPCRLIGQFAPSLYEEYTDRDEIRGNLPFLGYAPTFGQEDVKTFNNAKKFWQTPDGKGMADYSNRGFVSAGTNFDKPGLFPAPVFDPSSATNASIQELCAEEATRGRPCQNPNLTGTITFYGSNVEDRYRPSANTFNPRTSSHSAFDPDLTRVGRTPVFSLNRFNFYAAHDLLIPRAVGYSAGLINYFFRGKLDFKRDAGDATKFRIVNLGPEAMSGRFALYYDAINGDRLPVAVDPADPNRDPDDSNAWRLTIAVLNPAVPNSNLSAPISLIAPANDGSPLSPKVVNEYMLVFRGSMGEEKEDQVNNVIGAVVAKALKADLNGTLYVKVLRNNFTEAVLKVDKSGTRYLQGAEFNPLETYNTNSGFVNRPRWQAAWYKQVEFKPLPFGGHDYTVLSFSIPNRFVGHASYVRDANGNFVRRFRPISWIARNTPHGDFEFGFDIISFDFQSLVQYTRRYVQDGQVRIEQGTVPWPNFAAPSLNNRAGAVDSMPAISSDGLRVGGFIEALAMIDVSAGGVTEFRRDMVEHVVTLTPGAVPSTGLQSVPRQKPHTHSRESEEPLQRQTNEFVQTFTNCDGTLGSGFAREEQLKSLRHEQFTARTLHGVGAGVNGEARFVEYVDDKNARIGQDIVENAYPIGCFNGVNNAIRFTGRGDREALLTTVTSTAGTGRREAIDMSGGYKSFPHDTRVPYDSINVLPPWVPKPVQRGSALELIQTLGDKVNDAIYNEIDFGAGTGGLKFRGEATNFNSVADVSPVGEIFFASEDGNTLIHEPLQGGMPKIVLPPDVLRILGVLWL